MKHYKVMMVNDNIKDVRANAALPGNYYFRYFNEGDERIWAYIEAGAGEFKDEISAIQRFEDEFGKHIEELKKRCIFLCHEKDGPIGTAMAWYNLNFQGREYGRLHWVGIHPDHQGKKLARPLVAKAMERLRELHDKAYLTTQTTSWKAIKLYLDFGFIPFMVDSDCKEAWRLLALKLKHPALKNFI